MGIIMQDSLNDIRITYWEEMYQHWLKEELFTFPWFFNIAFIIILFIIWIKLVDKRRLKELLLFGSFIAITVGFIDIVAVTVGLWQYKVKLFPISTLFPFDYTVIPIFYMLVLQYTSNWRSYILGSLLAAAVYSFILSPVYIILGIKEYFLFNHFYVFITVFIVTSVIKAILNWILDIELRHKLNKD